MAVLGQLPLDTPVVGQQVPQHRRLPSGEPAVAEAFPRMAPVQPEQRQQTVMKGVRIHAISSCSLK